MYAGGSFILRSLCAKDTIAFILIIVCVMVFHFFPVAIVGTRRKIRGEGDNFVLMFISGGVW